MTISVADRYARNLYTLSPEDQQILAESRVCVIGLGGLGGGVCEMLVRAGVGHMVMADPDRFESSNLNRQLFSTEALIGQPKVEGARQRIAAVNSGTVCDCRPVRITRSNIHDLIQGSDLTVDCMDTIHDRFILQEAAGRASIPLVSGAVAGMTGQVTTIFPGDQGFNLIYPVPDGQMPGSESRGIEAETGTLGFCAMMVSALQASEAVKVLLKRGQVLRNRLLIADLLNNRFEIVDLI